MLRPLLFVLAALILAPATYAQMSDTELQELYVGFLASEGIEGWVDSDGDVQFEYNDRSYFMETNDGDNEFFRVVLWNIWPIESNEEAVQVAFAVDAANREMKVAKAYTIDDNVWIACELFVGEPGDFAPVWNRCMTSIEDAMDTFVGEM
ncbi:MAG: hypothetical protein AAGI52_03405 [Bacteroidota bacterium]